jgi:fumarylpyruvate hydrolase
VADRPYPTLTKNYHYEVEPVAALHKGGRDIPVERALDHVHAYSVGLDMTWRDPQRAMGDEKKPWGIGKGSDRSAPVGPLHPASSFGHPTRASTWLMVNGQTKQDSNLANMIWSVAEQVSRLSQAFELQPGDIVDSGTPENVGPVVRGDVVQAGLVRRREHQRVHVPLVPAFQVNVAGLLDHGRPQAEHVPVVLHRCRHVHHPQAGVADSQNSHH